MTPTPFAVPEKSARPDLVIHSGDLPASVYALRLVLSRADDLFDRGGVPVHLVIVDGSVPVARRMSVHAVTMKAHQHCRPIRVDHDGKVKAVTLPERMGNMWLDLGSYGLRPLAGVTTAPLLTDDGRILMHSGYHAQCELWCCPSPALTVPDVPTEHDARAALALLRQRFQTFPFADSELVQRNGFAVVDLEKPAGSAESAYLLAVMTAVCRPSLHLAPGLLVTAPDVTGAGSGKGLLVRAASAIAFGIMPSAFTAGHDRAELDKRLVAELIEAKPVVFLDNLNATALRSDTLASVLTERPARVRVMGSSQTVPLNSTAFIAVTGNGLTVSEDLARRFILVDIDARCENPEQRDFKPGFVTDILRDRPALLSACLTIWRWGRLNTLPRGLALGSFETWAAWCRDPLLALGCADPVERIRTAKANDPQRRALMELFAAWWEIHGAKPVTAAKLSPRLQVMIEPDPKSRQFITSRLSRMVGTRVGGFILTMHKPDGKWSPIAYALRDDRKDLPTGAENHRDHRGHRDSGAPTPPMTPMTPMPDGHRAEGGGDA